MNMGKRSKEQKLMKKEESSQIRNHIISRTCKVNIINVIPVA